MFRKAYALAIEEHGAVALPAQVRELVRDRLAGWDGVGWCQG